MTKTRVCIMGAGVVGLAKAHELSKYTDKFWAKSTSVGHTLH